MKEFLNKEIVVKRTVKGYLINCIIIGIVIFFITFLGVYITVNYIMHINPLDLMSYQQDVSAIPQLALQTTFGIMKCVVPLLALYMVLVTTFMLVYENKKIDDKKNKKSSRSKK